MKTLLFATMYLQDESNLRRYASYIDSFNHFQDLGISNIVLIDDASEPALLEKLGVPVTYTLLPKELPPVSVFSFLEHRGRPGFHDFQGWWRSFQYAPILAKQYGYDRLLHIESDARVISERLWTWLFSIKEGWVVLWCPKYTMPETAIQVICRDQFDNAIAVVPRTDTDPEKYLPFTEVNKVFKGDRYAEAGKSVPFDADFACQVGV